MFQQLKPMAVRVFGKTHFVRQFKPQNKVKREALRAYVQGLRIRFLLACGFGVVVIGACRSGKTFMLSRAFPGRVVAPDHKLVIQGVRPPFPSGDLPGSPFAVEEPQAFQAGTIQNAFGVLRGKRVVFSVQSIDTMQGLQLDTLFDERLVVVFLGTRADWEKEQRKYRPRRAKY